MKLLPILETKLAILTSQQNSNKIQEHVNDITLVSPDITPVTPHITPIISGDIDIEQPSPQLIQVIQRVLSQRLQN